ncbi:hypothetical protein BJ875DRAFT_459737 [Amylocarpus encephaloides]|uniref:F-box domain-containing protein n=1 Tax=Amylocarpus encephaloides TaxID=45428 RepID=A0A9P7YLE6_9HELO|nr:hypothetical protein BJ875DRAFT_459737 [Amylocarpus encephaloides]
MTEPLSTSQRPFRPTLTSMPTEIHLLIASNLTYPDALSLKHANRHFYNLACTGIKLKIEWLIERRTLHLDCPHDKGCELGSDMKFCRGSVKLLMERRRQHFECETRPGGRGCLIFGTKICTHQKARLSAKQQFKKTYRILFSKLGTLLWWLCLALIGAGVSWGWMEHQRRTIDAGSALVMQVNETA